jgi:hypothetical protein
MTRNIQCKATCHECGTTGACPSCGTEIDTFTPFSKWLRRLPYPLNSGNVDNENLDYIWFHYRSGWFITIEEKRYGAQSTEAQKDTHNIVAQMLELASGSPVQTWRGIRPIAYKGHFSIVFSHTDPDDSEWIEINERRSTKDDLMTLLETGKVPHVIRL